MKLIEALRLQKEYVVCPECGNEHIGNGEGALLIEDDTFTRTCKCGWSVTVKAS
ncbi:DUF3797 domain-containing protein [Paenibacillus sp. HN-1]|uniref:DUF3797 domain-containing protein n=1 Tax=Paenibacillus TaxID=44249 RepID=UPI001CA87885|nr:MULTISPECIES: DUF3797 domain-containing protein [Paenibacillus]MBY9077263.1 DUF3797 domain-containing protein [Paenibacillus sp. CGMCC 1.18879]MBY9083310.1 DUF3797 domain-containing protein [Paenibacillus sinensis]